MFFFLDVTVHLQYNNYLIRFFSLPPPLQVWSCSSCFSLFHLLCIQKWARDSVFLVSSVTDEDFGQKNAPWSWSVPSHIPNTVHLHAQHYSNLSPLVSSVRNVERSTLLVPLPTGMLTETHRPRVPEVVQHSDTDGYHFLSLSKSH